MNFRFFLSLVLPVAGVAVIALCPCRPSIPRTAQADTAALENSDSLAIQDVSGADSGPATFLPNLGQWSHPARYVSRLNSMEVFFQDHGWTFSVEEKPQTSPAFFPPFFMDEVPEEEVTRGVAIRMTFEDAAPAPVLEPDRASETLHHFFLGKDPGRWRSNVRGYGCLTYRCLYPGIDVKLERANDGLRYDLLVEPGADLEAVRIRVEGAKGLRLASDGSLVLDTCIGPVVQSRPRTWQILPDGGKRYLESHFVLLGPDRFGFIVEERSPHLALVVDPEISWATFLGGSTGESAWGIADDSSGNSVLVGYTRSTNFPTMPGAFSRVYSGGIGRIGDAIISKLSSDGSKLLWSTFLGGSENEWIIRVHLDPFDRVTVAGTTCSPDFPVTPGAYDTVYGGFPAQPGLFAHGYGGDAFVARLDSDGSRLLWSTFVGGTGRDLAFGLAVAPDGSVFIAGVTSAIGYTPPSLFTFPTTPGTYMPSATAPPHGESLGFVSHISSSGDRLVWSTLFSGNDIEVDWIADLALTQGGDVAVFGETRSRAFPTTPGALQPTNPVKWGQFTTFISILDGPTGSRLLASTYFGGKEQERSYRIIGCPSGDVLVAGISLVDGLPVTPDAFDPNPNMKPGTHYENGKGFIAKLSSDLTQLRWGTYVGGSEAESIKAIALSPDGRVHFTGLTESPDFPVTPCAPFPRFGSGWASSFYGCLSADGRQLLASTYIPGQWHVNGIGIAFGPSGMATVTGDTISADFPATQGAFSTSFNGYDGRAPDGDCFAARFRPDMDGVRRYGRDTPSVFGAVTIYPKGRPRAADAGFGLVCWKAPPNSAGLLVLTGGGLGNPLKALGADLWVDPLAAPFVTVAAFSDSKGQSSVPLPLPPGIQGARCHAQFVWLKSPACPGPGLLCASDALELTVQP